MHACRERNHPSPCFALAATAYIRRPTSVAPSRFIEPLRIFRSSHPETLARQSRLTTGTPGKVIAKSALSVPVVISTAPMLLQTAGITLLYQTIFCIYATVTHSETLTDFAGISNFLILALYTLPTPLSPRPLLASRITFAWGLRLGGYLLFRILQWGSDNRFHTFRGKASKQILFFGVQAVWVWLTALAVQLVNISKVQPPLASLDVIGASLSIVGILVEAVSDVQKFRHKSGDPQNKRWLETGLWKYSRHPNYFGEILMWIGVYLIALSSLEGWAHLAVLSPVFTFYILFYVSGVPILERRNDARFKDDQNYQLYKKNTSILVPMPKSWWRSISGD